MSLQSMTGFGRHEGHSNDISWVWEIRSVNSKGLDLRFRIPPGFEGLESKARNAAQKCLSRGNVQISLQTKQVSTNLVPVLNETALESIIKVSSQLQSKVGGQMPTAADLLSVRGVVELEEFNLSDEERTEQDNQLFESFTVALASLVSGRELEGAAIGEVLKSQLEKMTSIKDAISLDSERSPEAIRNRLSIQVNQLVSDNEGLDPQRLHQEAALLAAKADIQEELDRLSVHIDSALTVLAEEGPLGRKLDFLSQEFNRECNTICSKSNAASVSSLGLDMKLVIDQFREQVQNME